jgi:hypothetical protein
MRVKSVPRHLPRKDNSQGHAKAKTAALEYISKKRIEGSGSSSLKTVNFTNYHEFTQEIDLVVHKQVSVN